MVVAEKLGLCLSELYQKMTQEELVLWSMFYELKREEEQKAMTKARQGRR